MSVSRQDLGYAGPLHELVGGWFELDSRAWDARPRIWGLRTEDAEATVNAVGYFEEWRDAMRVGDLIHVTQVTGRGGIAEALVEVRWHQITYIGATIIAATHAIGGGAPGATAEWGNIAGTLAEQDDLAAALGAKAAAEHTHTGVYSAEGHTHSYAALSHVGAGGSGQHPDATTGTSGFLSAADKTKLDTVTSGADPNPDQVSPAEIAAGTSGDALRSFSADDVVDLIDAHAAGAGGGTSNAFYIVGGGGATQPTDTLIDIEAASLKAQIDVKFSGDTFADAEVINLTAGAGVQMAVTESPAKQVNITISGADVVPSRAALKALLKAGLSDGALRITGGWNAAGDGVGGAFVWDEDSAATADDATIIASDEGGTGRWLRVNADAAWNVKWFGARGDGSTADAAALNAVATAARAAGKGIFFPNGRYMVAAQVDLSGLHVSGASRDGAIIDVTGYTTVSSAALNWAGSAASLTTLSAGASLGAARVTVADDSAIAVGDWLVIYNSTNSSWSGFRTYYKAGEHVLVTAKEGSGVLALAAPLYDTYAVGMAVYKVTPTGGGLRNITVAGNPANSQYCVGFQWAKDVLIEDVTLRGSKNAVCAIDRCYGTTVRDCLVLSDDYGGTGTAYGVVVLNSARCRVLGGRFQAARHGVAMGGNDAVCCVPCRDVVVEDAWLTSTKERSGDIHGHAEGCGYRRCLLEGGLVIGGHRCFVIDCVIKAPAEATFPAALAAAEMLSVDHEIRGCTIHGASQNSGYASCIDFGGNNTPIQVLTTRPGTLRIHDCRLIVGGTATNKYALQIRQRGATVACAIDIRNMSATDADGDGVLEGAIYIDRPSGSYNWAEVNIERVRGGAFGKVSTTVQNADVVLLRDIVGTTKAAATDRKRGIQIKDCPLVHIRDCHITNTNWEGILIDQTSGPATFATIADCTLSGCVAVDGGVSSFDRAQIVCRSASGRFHLDNVTCRSKGALALQDIRLYVVADAIASNCQFLSASACAYLDTITGAMEWRDCVLGADRTTGTLGGSGVAAEYGRYRVGSETFWIGLPAAAPSGAGKVWADAGDIKIATS